MHWEYYHGYVFALGNQSGVHCFISLAKLFPNTLREFEIGKSAVLLSPKVTI